MASIAALGVAASCIQVIELGAKVISSSCRYINGVRRAPKAMSKVMDEVNSLTKVLDTLRNYANANPGSTVLSKLDGQDGPLQGCALELERLQQKLEPKEGWRKVRARLSWPLKEKDISEFSSRIERHKSLFVLALTADQLSSKITEQRAAELNWLSSEAFDKRHVEISEKRQQGTGEWILRTPEVLEWLEGSPNSRLLWGYGIPGAGKTFISSLMIDYLEEKASVENFGVAYIYFNYKEQDQQRPVHVLASLVKQLACQIQNLPKEIDDLRSKLAPRQKRPTLEELYTVLLVLTKSFSRTFVICDALDECDPEAQRRRLLPLFHRMGKDGLSLFLTSREHPEDIQHSFGQSAKVKLSAQDEDIARYIEQKIAENPRAKRLIGQGNHKDKIISELTKCAKGMFLFVHFQIEHLCKQTTIREIMTELEGLKDSSAPTEEGPLDPTYDRAIETILLQPKNCMNLAFRTLSWLVKAQKVLTVQELQLAVSVEQERIIFDEEDLPDKKTILDVCASLVTIDDTGFGINRPSTVRLAHYTVQEYLLKKSIIPEDADFQIAMACTTFLSFDIFAQGACGSDDDLRSRYYSYPFLFYAAMNLDFHLKTCDEALTIELVLRFLRNPGSISSYLQAHHWVESMGIYCPYDAYLKRRLPLHIAAFLGHRSAVLQLLEDPDTNIMAVDDLGYTALHLAASQGSEPVVQLLLEKGAEISATARFGVTVLHEAVKAGHESVVRLLLEKGADISAVGSNGWTTLHLALAAGVSESLVKLLLDKGANASAVVVDDRPSGWAGYQRGRMGRFLELVRGWTALHFAALGGSESVVRLLLEKGAGISTIGSNDETALHVAVAVPSGSESLVKLLLERGADVSARAYQWIPDGINKWTEEGQSAEMAAGSGWTTLHFAALRGSESLVQLLLENGADISAADKNGQTALHVAAEIPGGNGSLIRLLLDKGADISARIKLDPSREAGARAKWRETVGLGPEIGWTALHFAAERENESLVQLLLEKGADISAAGENGSTVLHMRAAGVDESLVRLLLEKGANTSALDQSGFTALHSAASAHSWSVEDKLREHESIVRLLLEKNVDPFAANFDGETALDLAKSQGHELVVDLLERAMYGKTGAVG